MSDLSYWLRIKRFYRTYGIVFKLGGLFVGGHLLWWQVQQNRLFVNPDQRRRNIGPINIPYLDELESKNNTEKGK
jgi:hypothetical protein